MRCIIKSGDTPSSIRDYLAAQQAVGHGFSYRTFSQTSIPGRGGTRGHQLCEQLTAEQFGLCAYTGAGIDIRLGIAPAPEINLKFSAHNEHLKPQSVCKQELIAAGKTVDEDLGEDMDPKNIVAALLVSGDGKTKIAPEDRFGAAHRENDPVPVRPIDPDCEGRFRFDGLGRVEAADPNDGDAKETIRVLNLTHGTLTGWREQAIHLFIEAIGSREDAELIIQKTTVPEDGCLPEYCFAIRQVVQEMIDLA
jgi:hypothetical protein